ncbi:MAG: hypothetical protein V7K21_29530 [Nostoc sp.]
MGVFRVGVSFTPVRLIARVLLSLAVPSLTVTGNPSVALLVSASIAPSMGVKVYAPVLVSRLSVP